MNVRVLKIYVLSLIDELNWMLWGWLLWVIDYLVDYGRLWWFWVMILIEWWICVRNKERTVGFLLKFWVGGWRLKMTKIQFGPSIYGNYSLVPKLWKIYRLVPGAYSEILNRIKDELWAEFQYSYEFLTLSIWSSNLTKIAIWP